MDLSEEKILKILFRLGLCIIAAIVYFLIFAFNTETEKHYDKIGFIITGDIHEKGWTESHYVGIKTACEKLNLKLLLKDHIDENSGQCPEAVEELISKGANVIFLMSFNYPSEVRQLIDKYSNVYFISMSTLEKSRNLTSCFARMYQGRYMAGALAGMKTKTNVIGYIAAMSNSEVNRGINAFALGVQRTNPKAKVLVMWTGDWQNEEIEAKHARRLIEEYDADILTYHQNEDATGKVAESFGADFIGYNALLEGYSEHYLTSVVCHWDIFYEDILQRYLKGELVTLRNSWVGVQQGAVNLSDYSKTVTPKMLTIINSIENELSHSNNLIFNNEIYDNKGKLRCAVNQVISDYELLKNINWLVKGVEVIE